MKVILDDLPPCASQRREAKIFKLAYHVYNQPDGISHEKLSLWGQKIFPGNVPGKIEEYIFSGLRSELYAKIGNKYYVTDESLHEWAAVKGFIHVPEDVICSNCGQAYNTSHSKCPSCGSVSRVSAESVRTSVSVPPRAHTRAHTEIPSEMLEIENNQIEPAPLSVPLGETAHLPIHIHTHTGKSGAASVQEGEDAEERVTVLLNQFGRAHRGRGSYGEPDVLWTAEKHGYGVEVKSVAHTSKSKAFKLNRRAWRDLCDYCEDHDIKPILVVEERINGSKDGHVYHWILREMVEAKLAASEADRVSFSIYELSTLSSQAVCPGKPFILRAVF